MNAHDFNIDDDIPPKIPPGFYEVQLKSHRTAMMFAGKAPKLILDFVIVVHGEFYGTVLPKYYNVRALKGPSGLRGRFKANPKGDFARDFFQLLGMSERRLDRLSMREMMGITFLAQVSTVKHARDRPIPSALQYSKIERLIKVVEGK